MSGYVEAKFLKDFTFRANIAVDETFAMRERYANKETGASKSYGGTMGRNYSDYMNINSQQLLTWAHDYGKHHVDALTSRVQLEPLFFAELQKRVFTDQRV